MTFEGSGRRAERETEPAEDWWELVERVREQIARERGDRLLPDITDLIHEMREERDHPLMDAIGSHSIQASPRPQRRDGP